MSQALYKKMMEHARQRALRQDMQTVAEWRAMLAGRPFTIYPPLIPAGPGRPRSQPPPKAFPTRISDYVKKLSQPTRIKGPKND